MKTKLRIMIIAAVICLTAAFYSFASTWEKDEADLWICYRDDGVQLFECWVDGYYLGEDGHIVTGSFIDGKGNSAYSDENGVCLMFTSAAGDRWEKDASGKWVRKYDNDTQVTNKTELPPERAYELLVRANHSITAVVGDITNMLSTCSTALDFLNAMYSSNEFVALLSDYCDVILDLTKPYSVWSDLSYYITQVKEALPTPIEPTVNLSDAQSIGSEWFDSFDKSLDYLKQYMNAVTAAPYAH